MTTIAYRHPFLAADTLLTANGARDGYLVKIRKLGFALVAASAEEAVRAAMKHDIYTGGDVTVLRH